MAVPLWKLTIIIGAGLIGSALSKEGRLSDVNSFFSGALKIITKNLQHDKGSSQSTSKPHTDSLLAQSARRHLSSRIDRVDSNIDECKELTVATKDEVSRLHGDLSDCHEDVELVCCAVQMLDFATEGVYRLCKFVEKLEAGRSPEVIQDSASSPRRTIRPPQNIAVTRMSSIPTLALESPTPSASNEPPRVLHMPKIISTSGLKELQISKTTKERNLRTSSIQTSNGIASIGEPSSSTTSSSGFGWRLPGSSVLTRTRSTAN